jgi:hypothetical protein
MLPVLNTYAKIRFMQCVSVFITVWLTSAGFFHLVSELQLLTLLSTIFDSTNVCLTTDDILLYYILIYILH